MRRLVGEERSAQAAQHFALFFGCRVKRFELRFIDKLLTATNESLRNHFEDGTGGDFEKPAKSFFDMRELPSAIFEEMETAARRIWFVRPNRSSEGNFRVVA